MGNLGQQGSGHCQGGLSHHRRVRGGGVAVGREALVGLRERGAALLLAWLIVQIAAPVLLGADAAEPRSPLLPQPIQYGPPRELCKLANQAINESSGLACSRRTPGVFWTHNDSGDAPRVYAFDREGRDLGTYRVVGAKARDWEDMASFRTSRGSFLVLGDIGDNSCERPDRTVYIAPEPRVHPKQRGVAGSIKVVLAISFTYEDGPHNCEAVAVDPKQNVLLLVTKEGGGTCRVCTVPMRKSGSARRIAQTAATLKIPTVSAMDISSDGLRAIVLTYGNAYEYSRQPNEDWPAAFARAPRIIKMPRRRQGETVCYGPDGKTLYLTSEKAPSPFFEVPIVEAGPGK